MNKQPLPTAPDVISIEPVSTCKNVPPWAVDLRFRNKSFVFTDGSRKAQFLDGGKADSSKVKNWPVVLDLRFKALPTAPEVV